jgi:hypothetical protein
MGDLQVRPSADDDIDAFLAIAHRAFTRATGRRAHWTADGMRRMRVVPGAGGRDPGLRFPVVSRDGKAVAWAGIFANPPYTEISTDLHVDPDLDGDDAAAATALLMAFADARGREAAAGSPRDPDRTLAVEALDGDDRLVRDIERLGFRRDPSSTRWRLSSVSPCPSRRAGRAGSASPRCAGPTTPRS